MYGAVSSRCEIPINIEKCGDVGNEFYRFDLEFVDTYIPEELVLLGEVAEDSVMFCPFCGRHIDSCELDLSEKWEIRHCICEDFLEWFMKGDEYCPNFKAPTAMFKYEPMENQFYMHCRKGFGDGWIPITHCIYCGEVLSEMVEKYGIPEEIADKLDPAEWHGKYKLCNKKEFPEDGQLSDKLSI